MLGFFNQVNSWFIFLTFHWQIRNELIKYNEKETSREPVNERKRD